MELGKYGMGVGQNNLPLPENDMQELHELSGKVKAALTYIEVADYPRPEMIYAMLSGMSQHEIEAFNLFKELRKTATVEEIKARLGGEKEDTQC